jgi:predicted transcriptional regulator
MPELVTRAQQIKKMVEDTPGITSREVAEKLGVTPGRVSQIVGAMKDAGDIEQRKRGRGQGLHLSDRALRRKYITMRWR